MFYGDNIFHLDMFYSIQGLLEGWIRIGCCNIQVLLIKPNHTSTCYNGDNIFHSIMFTAYMGCWKNGYMAFQGPGTSSYTQMTLRYCIRKCQSYGIKLVGLEVSQKQNKIYFLS